MTFLEKLFGKSSPETTLHEAVKNVDSDEVQRLTRAKKLKLDAKDGAGKTPLHWASSSEIAKLLLAAGFNVSAIDNGGHTPLHVLLTRFEQQDRVEIATLLLKNGSNANAKDSSGTTPLHWARSVEMVELLVSYNANVNETDQKGDTPLHMLINSGGLGQSASVKVVHTLLKNGASVNAVNLAGQTPLHLVGFNEEIAELLIVHKADVNVKDKAGRTVLFESVQTDRYLEMPTLLIQNGANVNETDNEGDTPLHAAALHAYVNTMEILVDSGANLKALNKKGNSAIDLLKWRLQEIEAAGTFGMASKDALQRRHHIHEFLFTRAR